MINFLNKQKFKKKYLKEKRQNPNNFGFELKRIKTLNFDKSKNRLKNAKFCLCVCVLK